MPTKTWSFEEVQDYASKHPNLRPKEVDGGWVAQRTPYEFQYEIPEMDVPETKYNLPNIRNKYEAEDIEDFGGSKIVPSAIARGTWDRMSDYRKDKLNRRADVLGERKIRQAKGDEKIRSRILGRPLLDKERKSILTKGNRLNRMYRNGGILPKIMNKLRGI